MSRRSTIGFDRRLDLDWLDAAAGVAARGSIEEMRSYLWSFLEGSVSGERRYGARSKTITVLNHIWGRVPKPAEPLRGRASALLADSTSDERLALHWAMMVATYPVFTDVAAASGRLLALQGSFTQAHLKRRLVSEWGERSTLERACRRIIRSMIQWEALQETATAGLYVGTPRRRKVGPAAGKILLEALLVDSEDSSLPLDRLIGHPALFPFELEVNASHVRGSLPFRLHREGLDADFVELERG